MYIKCLKKIVLDILHSLFQSIHETSMMVFRKLKVREKLSNVSKMAELVFCCYFGGDFNADLGDTKAKLCPLHPHWNNKCKLAEMLPYT